MSRHSFSNRLLIDFSLEIHWIALDALLDGGPLEVQVGSSIGLMNLVNLVESDWMRLLGSLSLIG